MVTSLIIIALFFLTLASSWYAHTLSRKIRRQTTTSKQHMSELVHDLRNPLTTALLNLEEMREQAHGVEFGETIKTAWNSLKLINRFIEVDQHNRRDRTIGWFSPADEIELAIFALQSKSAQRQVDIRFQNTTPLQLHGDAIKFYQIVTNLVSNAIDSYLNYPVMHPFVTVMLEEKEQVAILTVIDYGGGIQEKNRRHIFKRGFTTKSAKDGTGIGLNIAKNSLKDFGGSITFESKLNQGTLFRIEFPTSDLF